MLLELHLIQTAEYSKEVSVHLVTQELFCLVMEDADKLVLSVKRMILAVPALPAITDMKLIKEIVLLLLTEIKTAKTLIADVKTTAFNATEGFWL